MGVTERRRLPGRPDHNQPGHGGDKPGRRRAGNHPVREESVSLYVTAHRRPADCPGVFAGARKLSRAGSHAPSSANTRAVVHHTSFAALVSLLAPARGPEVGENGKLFLEGLVKFFGRKEAVRGVTFSMDSGEVVGLLGPNGAGKTTVFYMVVGFIRPTAGRIWLNGHDVTGLPDVQARDALASPTCPRSRRSSESSPWRTTLPPSSRRGPPSHHGEKKRLRDRLLDDLGIAHLRKQKAYTLSGGERRRTEIARSLAIEPKFLLLDEPFAGIDPITVSELKGIVQRLSTRGIGVLHHGPQRSRHPGDNASVPHHQPRGGPCERQPGGDPGQRAGPKDLPWPRVRDIAWGGEAVRVSDKH